MLRLAKKHPELKGKGERVKRTFAMLCHFSARTFEDMKERAEWLMAQLRNIPDHMSGDHSKCSQHAATSKGVKDLQDASAIAALRTLMEGYASNAAKFCIGASSNANEGLNNMIATLVSKRLRVSSIPALTLTLT